MMIKRIWKWLFPNPLEAYDQRQLEQQERIRSIKESFTPEMHAAAARIVAMHDEERRQFGGGSSSSRSSSSSSSRSDSSCTGFDD